MLRMSATLLNEYGMYGSIYMDHARGV